MPQALVEISYPRWKYLVYYIRHLVNIRILQYCIEYLFFEIRVLFHYYYCYYNYYVHEYDSKLFVSLLVLSILYACKYRMNCIRY